MISPVATHVMHCDEEGCVAQVFVRLALQMNGGWAFLPADEKSAIGWQVLLGRQVPVFKSYCAKHVKEQPVIKLANGELAEVSH